MKPTVRKKSPSRKRPPKKVSLSRTSPATSTPVSPSDLSSVNIAKLLSGFMTFRSTLKELNHSLQRIQSFMDSAYQVFQVTSNMMVRSRRRGFGPPPHPFRPLPPHMRRESPAHMKREEEEEIPRIHLPLEQQGESSAPSRNLDLNQLWNMVRSPLFQNLISGFLRGKSNAPPSSPLQRKRG